MTTSIKLYPSKITKVNTITIFVGHIPITYRDSTIVLIPARGPKVATYATGKLPTSIPRTAQSEASRKGREKTVGPSIPRVVLLAARLMENQRMMVWVRPR